MGIYITQTLRTAVFVGKFIFSHLYPLIPHQPAYSIFQQPFPLNQNHECKHRKQYNVLRNNYNQNVQNPLQPLLRKMDKALNFLLHNLSLAYVTPQSTAVRINSPSVTPIITPFLSLASPQINLTSRACADTSLPLSIKLMTGNPDITLTS